MKTQIRNMPDQSKFIEWMDRYNAIENDCKDGEMTQENALSNYRLLVDDILLELRLPEEV